jgi:tetratricopeptide (TPR) repeat protein
VIRGREYAMRKMLVAAIAWVILTTSPAWAQDAMHYYNLGLKSSLNGTKIEYFTRAIELDPGLADAYEKRAMIYYFENRFAQVIQDDTRAIEIDPGLAEAYRLRGMAYLKEKKPEEAVADFDQILRLDPKSAVAYGLRAEADRLEGRMQAAIRDATEAIHLRGDDRTTASAYATRAKSYEKLGLKDRSEADLKMYYELDPRYFFYREISRFASLKSVSRMGLVGIIVLLFVGIFHLTLPAPRKKDG